MASIKVELTKLSANYFTKTIGYQLQYVQKDKTKEYPHGWGWTPPHVVSAQEMDNAELVEVGTNLIDKKLREEFECIGGVPVEIFIDKRFMAANVATMN